MSTENTISASVSKNSLSDCFKAFDHTTTETKEPLIKEPYCWGILGPAGCGKSTLLCSTFYENGYFNKFYDKIFMFSKTAKNQGKIYDLYKELDDEKQYYEHLTNENLESVKNNILKVIDFHINQDEDGEQYDEKYDFTDAQLKKRETLRQELNFCIILDDMLCDMNKKNSSIFDDLITNRRHLRLSIIFCVQKWKKKVSTTIRSNLSFLSVFKLDRVDDENSLFEEYGTRNNILEECYNFATTPTEKYSHPFLHIRMKPRTYYRIFDEIVIK